MGSNAKRGGISIGGAWLLAAAVSSWGGCSSDDTAAPTGTGGATVTTTSGGGHATGGSTSAGGSGANGGVPNGGGGGSTGGAGGGGGVDLLFADNFDGYADGPENHGWSIPSAATVEPSDSPDGGRALKFTVQATGTAEYWSSFDPNPAGIFAEGYIAFWAKVVGHEDGTPGGVKWLKLFSADYYDTPATYANVTFGQDYGSGHFYSVGAGGGLGPLNDTQVGYRYNGNVSAGTWSAGTDYAAGYIAGYGTNQAWGCKLAHTASSGDQPGVGANWSTYWDLIGTVSASSDAFYAGTGWHHYEYYVKHNTDGSFDGEFAVWVDGELKLRASALRNRSDVNSMDWSSASLVNHVEIAAPTPYSIYFDAITVSEQYVAYVAP